MLTGNKGEWSEIYALFKLLGDKQLFAGDADLNKVEELFYPIIKIIRNESGGDFEYEINGDLVIISGGKEQLRIPVKIFTEQASKLLTKIKGEKGKIALSQGAPLFMVLHLFLTHGFSSLSTFWCSPRLFSNQKKSSVYPHYRFGLDQPKQIRTSVRFLPYRNEVRSPNRAPALLFSLFLSLSVHTVWVLFEFNLFHQSKL
jgi:hypothetical protein